MRALAHAHDATTAARSGVRLEQQPLAERARPLDRPRAEERRRRSAVGAREHHRPGVRRDRLRRRDERPRARRAYAVVKPVDELAAGRGELGLLHGREQGKGEEEGEIEDGIADVRDLRVEHPRALGAEQDVLGRVVAVHEARARVAQLLHERLERSRRGGGGAPSPFRDTARAGAGRTPRSRRTRRRPRRRRRWPRAGGRACRRPSAGGRMRAAGEQLGLPVAPAGRCVLQHDDVLAGVAVDHGRRRGPG